VKFSQLFTAPNQLTLLRMVFLPFIIINMMNEHYEWALVLFVLAGLSDGLDGLLARKLQQQTMLGQYLDPIADKLLLSTIFLVLSVLHKIPWKFTVMVFSRDICILVVSAVLYMIAGLRDFRPSIFGKANTFAQVAAVFFGSRAPLSCAPPSYSPLSPGCTMCFSCSTACAPTRPKKRRANAILRCGAGTLPAWPAPP
jgi:cardiolipin synthase